MRDHPIPELNESGNFECLGHSNWTICSICLVNYDMDFLEKHKSWLFYSVGNNDSASLPFPSLDAPFPIMLFDRCT